MIEVARRTTRDGVPPDEKFRVIVCAIDQSTVMGSSAELPVDVPPERKCSEVQNAEVAPILVMVHRVDPCVCEKVRPGTAENPAAVHESSVPIRLDAWISIVCPSTVSVFAGIVTETLPVVVELSYAKSISVAELVVVRIVGSSCFALGFPMPDSSRGST